MHQSSPLHSNLVHCHLPHLHLLSHLKLTQSNATNAGHASFVLASKPMQVRGSTLSKILTPTSTRSHTTTCIITTRSTATAPRCAHPAYAHPLSMATPPSHLATSVFLFQLTPQMPPTIPSPPHRRPPVHTTINQQLTITLTLTLTISSLLPALPDSPLLQQKHYFTSPTTPSAKQSQPMPFPPNPNQFQPTIPPYH